MAIGEIKNLTSQVVSQYEKNSGANASDIRQAAAARTTGVAASPDVKVDFSSKSQDFVQIKSAIAQLPEVREEKVDALKEQIQSGTYKIDSAGVAEKMVKESLLDIFA